MRILSSALRDAISAYERRQRAEFAERDRNTRSDLAEYSEWRDTLEHETEYRLPRFAAYSVVTLLHSILEVHLRECANEAMQWKHLQFSPDDIEGSGIQAYGTYLAKSGVYDVEADSAWTRMKGLRDLRNLIVHGAGTPSKKRRKMVNRLKQEFKKDFKHSGDWWRWNEIWISPELCQKLTDEVEGFAGRCLSAVRALAPQ